MKTLQLVLAVSFVGGRIGSGAVMVFISIPASYLMLGCLVVSALASILVTEFESQSGVLVCSALVSSTGMAAYGNLVIETLLLVVGEDDFTSAYGSCLTAMGVGILLGPPITGIA